MARADGSIIINTKGDATGFDNLTKKINNGLAGIKSSFIGVATAMGVAFGIKAIINFGRESVLATNELKNAMIGLKSILDGQGRSFAEAKEFINEYVSDGLIPATQAINAYKNLALRGYDDTQIQQVLVALKDAAAFGRQASYTMGEAVQSATEGLKNENSILVDNAGVTKNVAKMWEDYAKKIGVATTSLTKQQKIQAEVMGILEETKFQTGDAAKVAKEYSGQLMALGFNFNNLKIAVGNAIMPIAWRVLPGLNSVITALTRVANLAAQVTTALFGKRADVAETTAKTVSAAADAENDLAKATTKAGKAAKGALAGFDELNVLVKGMAENTADATENLEFNAGGIGIAGEIGSDITVSPKVQEVVDKIKGQLSKLQPYVDGMRESWDGLKESFNRFISAPGVQIVLSFLGELVRITVASGIAAGLKAIAGALDLLGGSLEVVGGYITLFVGLLNGDFAMAMKGSAMITEGLGKIIKGLGEIAEAIFIILLGKDAVEAIKQFAAESGEQFKAWWELEVSPWFTKKRWLALFDTIKGSFKTKWAETENWWSTSVRNWFEAKVKPWFTKEKWIEMMAGIKEGFRETFKNAINAAIELFNKFIGWINEKMRFEWDAITVAGKTLVPAGSVQLINIPYIPRLATGAVIPPNAEFLAILGDQTHGRNIEAPEGLIRQIIREELANMPTPEVTVVASGSASEIIRYFKFEIDREKWRRGHSLVKGGY